MKRVIALLIFLLLLVQYFASEEPVRIKAGSEPDYPPFCLVNKNGEAEGFSIDLFKAACDKVNLKYSFETGLWKNIKVKLKNGEIDALPLVGRTPEREPWFDFTFPYISLHGAIFVRKAYSGISNIEDLRQKEIIVMKGDNAEEFIRRSGLYKKVITTDTFEDAFRLLQSGKHDAVVTQRVMGLQLLQSMKISNIQPLDIPLKEFRQDFCFAVKEGDKELLAKLNEGLAIVISGEEYKQISQKWLTPVFEQSLSLKQKIKLAANIIIPVILIIAFILIIFMRREVRRKTKALKKQIDENIIATEKLESSERKFRSYINNAPIGIFVVDEKGNYLEVNNAACEMTGYDQEELLQMNIADFSTAKEEEERYKNFNSLKGKDSNTVEKEYVTKSGEKRYWRIDAVKLAADRYLGFTTDTTQKWLFQTQLKENKDKLQKLFDNMNNGFAYHKMIFDEDNNPRDYVILEINKAFERILGVNKEDVIGKRITEIIPDIKSDPEKLIEKYGRVALRGISIKIEVYHRMRDKWFSVNAYSTRKGYFATTFEDITVRKKAEKELKNYQANLEKQVKKRTAELEEMNSELAKYNKLFTGREFRIKELRDEVKELKARLQKYM